LTNNKGFNGHGSLLNAKDDLFFLLLQGQLSAVGAWKQETLLDPSKENTALLLYHFHIRLQNHSRPSGAMNDARSQPTFMAGIFTGVAPYKSKTDLSRYSIA
jgi:hypothetical protein